MQMLARNDDGPSWAQDRAVANALGHASNAPLEMRLLSATRAMPISCNPRVLLHLSQQECATRSRLDDLRLEDSLLDDALLALGARVAALKCTDRQGTHDAQQATVRRRHWGEASAGSGGRQPDEYAYDMLRS